MDTEHPTLEDIPANRRLIDELYAHGKISRDARQHALDLLYPHTQWGLWISRLLLASGTALVLSGIVYFFAFNWAQITPMVKLFSIQLGIIACLAGACLYSLRRLGGQVLLLSASVLVGVFMAVFGQIYQTGADAWQLFMVWSLLIFGWTVMSGFAAQWLLWLVISNVWLVLWWEQAVIPPDDGAEFMLFTCMAALNGTALALREYGVIRRGYDWPAALWTRLLPVVVVLLSLFIPVAAWIIALDDAGRYTILSGVIGLIGHGVMYGIYRYRVPDIWSLCATVLSGCMMLEVACARVLSEVLPTMESSMALIMGLITLGVFTCAIIHLRKMARAMAKEGVSHV